MRCTHVEKSEYCVLARKASNEVGDEPSLITLEVLQPWGIEFLAYEDGELVEYDRDIAVDPMQEAQ